MFISIYFILVWCLKNKFWLFSIVREGVIK